MRVPCPKCKGKMTVTHPTRITPEVTDLNCICRTCGYHAAFVLAHKHEIKPNPSITAELVAGMISVMPPEELARLRQEGMEMLTP